MLRVSLVFYWTGMFPCVLTRSTGDVCVHFICIINDIMERSSIRIFTHGRRETRSINGRL